MRDSTLQARPIRLAAPVLAEGGNGRPLLSAVNDTPGSERHQQAAEPRPQGWLLVPADAVPAQWAERALAWSLVPLLPSEVAALQSGAAPSQAFDATDQRLAHLTAQGMVTYAMARELGVSVRTVQRRLGRLRRELGVATKAELATELARRGF